MSIPAAKCRSCGDAVIWLKTSTGKSMPVDLIQGQEPATGAVFDPKLHRSHFATCPNANKHRKEKS